MNYIRTLGDSKLMIEGNRLSTFDKLHNIGDYFGGGIVFYTWSGGTHGYIVSTTRIVPSSWGCYGTPIGTTSTTIGSGKQNTLDIVLYCAGPSMAKTISQYTKEGYDDWFCPSRDELLQVESVKSLLSYTWNLTWSSSEYDPGNSIYIDTSFTSVVVSKLTGLYGAPIREF